MRDSPSKGATNSVGPADNKAEMAPSAPSPASTQPSRATTSTGPSSTRSMCRSYRVTGDGPGSRRLQCALRHLGQADHAGGESIDAAAVSADGPAHVPGVHALQDAGQFPVTE